MKHLLSTVALLAALIAPSAASARQGATLSFPPPPPNAQVQAQAAAVQFWGSKPCHGQVHVTYAPLRATDSDSGGVNLGGQIGAVTSFDTPTGPMDWTQPPSSYTDCVITFNTRWWWPSAERYYFPDFCGLMVHEYGHLFGNADSAQDSPGSILYPIIGPRNERVWSCSRRYHLFG